VLLEMWALNRYALAVAGIGPASSPTRRMGGLCVVRPSVPVDAIASRVRVEIPAAAAYEEIQPQGGRE